MSNGHSRSMHLKNVAVLVAASWQQIEKLKRVKDLVCHTEMYSHASRNNCNKLSVQTLMCNAMIKELIYVQEFHPDGAVHLFTLWK